MTLKILYEDNHLLFVEKPPNMPVQADNSQDLDLLTALKDLIKVRDQKPGNVYLALVHRLDRPTGGLMVFAKTSKAAGRVSNEIRQQAMERHYLAIVHGELKKDSGELINYLYKDRQKNKSFVCSKDHQDARFARLTYQQLASQKQLSLVQITLDTGRSHQIRLQLANLGHPIYGDQLYGPQVNRPGQQLALWATKLQLKHPTLKEPVQVHSQPPWEDLPWSKFKDKYSRKEG